MVWLDSDILAKPKTESVPSILQVTCWNLFSPFRYSLCDMALGHSGQVPGLKWESERMEKIIRRTSEHPVKLTRR